MNDPDDSQTVSVGAESFVRRREATGPLLEGFGPPPELSDRYRIVGVLGRGGVGVVYRGWDEELGRPVAIKFLRPDRPRASDASGGFAARLRLESMALAALSDPNVVTVFDVVEGPDGVGIVMELIEGADLKTWLRARPRAQREVLDVFIAAGRGLEAAHAAGLVHRDFKPGNVMVGADGRVRVLDFGLARLAASNASRTRSSGRHIVVSRATGIGSSGTDHGAVMGTPAYMAPEQIDGLPLDARTDQFSFCVALHEALSGERPFEADTLEARRTAIEAGPPMLTGVSRRLRDAVFRGLAAEPDSRHPSMSALLEAMEAQRRPVSNLAVLVGLGLVGIIAWGASFSVDRDVPCLVEDPSESWSEERRAELRAAFLDVGTPWAAEAFERTEGALDAYVQRWASERDAACEGADPRRLACLGRVKTRFDAAMDVFGTGNEGVVENASSVVRRLPEPQACETSNADSDELDDPELQALDARARALVDAGRYALASRTAHTLLENAVVARNASYEASGLRIIGSCLEHLGEYDAALSKLEDAYFVAIRIGAHRTAAQAALDAAATVGMGARRPSESQKWLRHARTQIALLDDPDAVRARMAVIEGGVALMAGERDEGLARLEEARALWIQLRGEDDLESINVLNNIGMVYQEMGRFEEALAYHERARDRFATLNGPEHPSVSHAEHALAQCQANLGMTDEAVRTYTRVIRQWEDSLGEEHPSVAMAHYNVGHVHQMAGAFEPALKSYLRAIALLEASMGRDHINTAMALHNAGSVYHELEHLDASQTYLERSLASFESSEVNPLYLAINRYELATVLHARGVEPDRVATLLGASVGELLTEGVLGAQEREEIEAWIRANRPDLGASLELE